MRETFPTDLHQFPDHIPAHNMIKDGLKSCVLHQTELDPVPMPGEDGAGLQGGHRHLEELVRGDTEPLRRVEELVVIDQMQGSPTLGHDQSANMEMSNWVNEI